MITPGPRWSLPRGNTLVPSRWQATLWSVITGFWCPDTRRPEWADVFQSRTRLSPGQQPKASQGRVHAPRSRAQQPDSTKPERAGPGPARADDLPELPLIAQSRKHLDSVERQLIEAARAKGATWKQIGLALGSPNAAPGRALTADGRRRRQPLTPGRGSPWLRTAITRTNAGTGHAGHGILGHFFSEFSAAL
jgi:hypothetical protein